MGFFKRIGRIISMFFSFFVERVEGSVPLERRLAYDRQQKAVKFKGMMDKATDVGQAAELMVQGLAQARIVYTNLVEEARSHLKAAKSARGRGDAETEQEELAAAAALADEIGEAEGEVAQMEQDVGDALSDKQEAKEMVLGQARELERLSRSDSRLVAKVRMAEMKEQSDALRIAMMGLIPEDRDNIRQHAREQANKKVARVNAKRDITDALWKQKKRGQIAQSMQQTARGAQILSRLQKEVGYIPAEEPTSIEEVEAMVQQAENTSSTTS